MFDCDLIFNYLLNHPGWHNVVDIMRELKPSAVNWAVRSRIAELNERFKKNMKPYRIESRLGENGCADYRIVECKAEQMVMGL